MQWRQIRSAVEVAKRGSFTRAAEVLHVSQPALSEQVKLLEDRLGFALFTRTGRGVEVSEKGRTFLHEANRIANDMAHLQEVARNLLADSAETIKIGIISGHAPLLVQRMFPLGEAPCGKQYEINTAPTRVILDGLFQGRLDAGFAIAAAPEFIPAGLSVQPLFEVELVLAVPPHHPLAQQDGPCRMEQLAGQPVIMNELSVGYGLSVMEMFGRLGLHPHIQAVVDNIDTTVALVKAGVGIAIVPAGAAENEARLGGVRIVRLDPVEHVTIELYRPRARMTRFKEEFLERVVKGIGSARDGAAH